MSRRYYKRINHLEIDPKYQNIIITKMINIFMVDGKKEKSKCIIYEVLRLIKIKFLINPIRIIFSVLDISRPILLIKKRKLGGAIYNIPYYISKFKGYCIVLHWLRNLVIKNNTKIPIVERIFRELINTYNNNGSYLFIKKLNLYKLAAQNRVFCNFIV